MNDFNQKLTITAWAEADRPREKLLQHGRRQLSDAELIAILIGSGNKNETAVDLSKRILHKYDNNLDRLAQVTVADLSTFKGIGEAKAIAIVAALELGRRRKEQTPNELVKITSPKDAYSLVKADLEDLPHEEFWVILLANNHKVLGKFCVSKGGLTGTVVDPKVVFKIALENNAAKMVLVHNHPSGNLKPSEEDIKLTKRLIDLGRMMGLLVADHIIVSNEGYLSLANENLI